MADITYTPSAAEATFTSFAGVAFIQRRAFGTFRGKRIDAEFFLKPIQDEVLNLIAKVNTLENGGSGASKDPAALMYGFNTFV